VVSVSLNALQIPVYRIRIVW